MSAIYWVWLLYSVDMLDEGICAQTSHFWKNVLSHDNSEFAGDFWGARQQAGGNLNAALSMLVSEQRWGVLSVSSFCTNRFVHASCCKLHPQAHLWCMAVIDAIICLCRCCRSESEESQARCFPSRTCQGSAMHHYKSLEQSLGAAAGCRAEDPSGSCCREVLL